MNKYYDGIIPENVGLKNETDEELEKTVIQKVKSMEENMDSYHISNALGEIWAIITRSNKYIDETMPWALAKSEEAEDKEKLKSVMYHLAENLRIVAVLLQPFMSNTAVNMFKQLGIEKENLKEWNSIKEYGKTISGTKVIEKGEPLFMRLDMNEEVEYIREAMKG
jgi:methionyl-tRNA synthetase